jgi:hypothetical protein
MYTELVLALELVKDPPDEVVRALQYMTSSELDEYEEGGARDIKHPFFRRERWRVTLRGDSYYFPGDSHATFRFDAIANRWFLTVRSNMKNYDGEIQAFLSFIAQYTEPGYVRDDETFFVGYARYEENNDPTLIYFTVNRGVIFRDVEGRTVSHAQV